MSYICLSATHTQNKIIAYLVGIMSVDEFSIGGPSYYYRYLEICLFAEILSAYTLINISFILVFSPKWKYNHTDSISSKKIDGTTPYRSYGSQSQISAKITGDKKKVNGSSVSSNFLKVAIFGLLVHRVDADQFFFQGGLY